MHDATLISRRSLLALPAVAMVASAEAAVVPPKQFSFAYLTDIHVQPERGGGRGLIQCLGAVNSLPQTLDFTLTGGDLIMDALEVSSDRLHLQWDLFDECWKMHNLPTHHTVGNHDVGGWSSNAKIPPGTVDYGKQLFADRYGQGKTYRSFNHNGWHFILLDSIGQNPETLDYLGWIDEEQVDWLQRDLETTGKSTPIVIVSHIPFHSVWGQMNSDPREGENPKSLVNNAHLLRKMLLPYNVPLILSGHGHVVERIEFGNTTYLQGGAVCGMWWKGPVFGNPEGFFVVTCHNDGTFSSEYHDYGWKAVG